MHDKTNPYSNYSMQIQTEVLTALQSKNGSTKEIASRIKRPYHTVRQAILELENNGEIHPTNRTYRNTVYKIDDGAVINSRIMPVLVLRDNFFKINALLPSRKIKTQGEIAAENIPKHVTRILKVAERLHKGDTAAALSLDKIKHEMEVDRASIANALDAYNQLLKNGKIWDASHLAKFPNDTYWDQEDLDESYKHYFTEE